MRPLTTGADPTALERFEYGRDVRENTFIE